VEAHVPTPTKSDRQFGEIAVRNKLLSKKQVEECLEALEEGDIRAKTLAEAVEQKGLLSPRAVASIARAQNYREVRLESKLYGRIVVKSKFAAVDDVKHGLEEQKKAYLRGEPPPELGEILVKKKQLAKAQDRAVRDALKKLDKEQHIARPAEAAEEPISGLDSGDDEAPAAPTGKRPPPRGGAKRPPPKGGAKESGRAAPPAAPKAVTPAKGAPAVKGAPARPSDDDIDDVEPDEELDMALDSADDIATADRGALTTSSERARPPEAPAPPSSSAISSISESNVGEASSGSISEVGSAKLAAAQPIEVAPAPVEAARAGRKRGRDDETDDNMDAILEPDDLSDLAQLGVAVSPRTIGQTAKGAATVSPGAKAEPKGESSSAELELPRRFEEAAQAAKEPDLEPIDELSSDDETEAAPAPAPKTASSAKVRVAAPRAGGRCPECNVTLEPGTKECIYCGHVMADEAPAAAAPALAAESRAKAPSGKVATVAAAPAPAAKVEVPEGVAEEPFATAFSEPRSLGRGPRGEVLRAKAADSGEERLIVRLPASLAPEPAQVTAFVEESGKVAGLSLRHVLTLEKFAHDDAGYYAVYEDAPGAPASAIGAPVDRMRAAKVAKEVASALAETAGAGIFARELRPEMVILPEGADGSPRILGFGLARLFEPPATGAPTDADCYLPPERAKKADRADARTEIFGVGALLLLLLTAHGPTGKEPKELPNVPGGLRTVLLKTLDPVTGKRYVDHGRLLDDIDKAPGAKGFAVDARR
jgi:hypothetical protein